MDFDKTFRIIAASAETLAGKLSDVAEKGNPSLQLETQRDLKGRFGGGQWKLAAGARGRIALSVFVNSSDVDPDGIFGAADNDDARPVAALNPTPGQAWIKYEITGDAEGKVGTGSGSAEIAASGKAGIALGAYNPAPSNATLAQALRHSSGVPFVFDASDVRQLATGQAAYVSVGGTLAAKLEFNWADMLTGPITPLQGLIAGDKPLNLVVDSRAGLAVAITISDSFRLVFCGVDADYVTVSLNRAGSNAFSVEGGADARVRLEKPDMFRGLLAKLAAQLLGVEPGRVEAVREQLETALDFYDNAVDKLRSGIPGLADKLDALIEEHGLALPLTRLQQLLTIVRLVKTAEPDATSPGLTIVQATKAAEFFDRLAENLAGEIGNKLDELLAAIRLPALVKDSAEAVRGLLERLAKIETALLKMARTRIERGLSFEYRRIATDASVLKARLLRRHADFDHWHQSLLGLDATSVLAASDPDNSNVILDFFLNRKSFKRSVSLGLNLGWFCSERDSAQTQWSESTRLVAGAGSGSPLQIERRLALQGSRSRAETIFGTPAKCSGQFDADFVALGPVASAGRWRFALSLAYASETGKADRRWLLALADYACVWGVIDESRIDWLVGTLEDDGAIGEKVAMEVAFTIDRAAFSNPACFAAFAGVTDAELSRAFAIALQRMEQFPERTTPGMRAATYANAVSVLLGKNGIDITRAAPVARFVARHLTAASRDLKAFEAVGTRPIPAGSVAYLAQHTGSALGAVSQFKQVSSLSALAGVPARGSAAECRLVGDAFKGLDLAWRDRFLLRWQVCLLQNLVANAAVSAATNSVLKTIVGLRGGTRIVSRRPAD